MAIWRRHKKEPEEAPSPKKEETKAPAAKSGHDQGSAGAGEPPFSFVAKSASGQAAEVVSPDKTSAAREEVSPGYRDEAMPRTESTPEVQPAIPLPPTAVAGTQAYASASVETGRNAEPPYDYTEDYFASSATQSFLHDSYYPHMYHYDWHDTGYDEIDRAQDYYQEEAYRTADEYWQDYYRDQEAAQTYGGQSRHAGPADPSGWFASSAIAAAGLAAAERSSDWGNQAPDIPEVPAIPGFPDVLQPSGAPDYAAPVLPTQLEQAYAYPNEAGAEFPPQAAERLTVNRFEDPPDSPLNRLTVNQPEENLPTRAETPMRAESLTEEAAAIPLQPQQEQAPYRSFDHEPEFGGNRLTVNRVGEFPDSTLERLTVNRAEENLPTSENAPLPSLQQHPADAAFADFTPERSANRLTVNRFEAEREPEGTRLTVNQDMSVPLDSPSLVSSEAAAERLTVNQIEELSDSSLNRLTVNRLEENLPTSEEAAGVSLDSPIAAWPTGATAAAFTAAPEGSALLHDVREPGESGHRLIVNQVGNYPDSTLERLTVNQAEDESRADPNRLTVNRVEEILPTSAAPFMTAYPFQQDAAMPQTGPFPEARAEAASLEQTEWSPPPWGETPWQPADWNGIDSQANRPQDRLAPWHTEENAQAALFDSQERLMVNQLSEDSAADPNRLTVNRVGDYPDSTLNRLTVNRFEENLPTSESPFRADGAIQPEAGFSPIERDYGTQLEAALLGSSEWSPSSWNEFDSQAIHEPDPFFSGLSFDGSASSSVLDDQSRFIDNPEAAAERLTVNRFEAEQEPEGNRLTVNRVEDSYSPENILPSSAERLIVNQAEEDSIVDPNRLMVNQPLADIPGFPLPADTFDPQQADVLPKNQAAQAATREASSLPIVPEDWEAHRLTVHQLEEERPSLAEEDKNRLTVNRFEAEQEPEGNRLTVNQDVSVPLDSHFVDQSEATAERLTVNRFEENLTPEGVLPSSEERLTVNHPHESQQLAWDPTAESEYRDLPANAETSNETPAHAGVVAGMGTATAASVSQMTPERLEEILPVFPPKSKINEVRRESQEQTMPVVSAQEPDANRLTVNRSEENLPRSEAPFAATADSAVERANLLSEQETEVERLTINQLEEERLAVATENENRLMVNQAEADSAADLNRLTVNRVEENLPTSEAPFLAGEEAASTEESLLSSQETEVERLMVNRAGEFPDSSSERLTVNQVEQDAQTTAERLTVNHPTSAEQLPNTEDLPLKEGSPSDAVKQEHPDGLLPAAAQAGSSANPLDWEVLLLEAQQKANSPVLEEDPLHASPVLPKQAEESQALVGKDPLFVGYSQVIDENQVAQAATFLVEPTTPEEKTRHVVLDPVAQKQEKKQQAEDSVLPDEKEQLTTGGTLTDPLLNEDKSNPAVPSSRSAKAKHHLKEAGAASLGVLGGLGHLTEKAVVGTGKTITAMASRAVQEDETFAAMDEARKTVVQSATKAWAHNRAIRNRDFIRERFVKEHIVPLGKRKKNPDLPAGVSAAGVSSIHTPAQAVDARRLDEQMRAKKFLAQKKSLLQEEPSPENSPILPDNKGLPQKQSPAKSKEALVSVAKKEEAAEQLLKKKEEREPDKKKRPATKRERERVSKTKALKESKAETAGILPAGAMLTTVNTAKRGAILGAETAAGIGGSSLRKMVTKDNEQVAMLFTIKDRAMQAAGAVRSVVRAPRRIAQAVSAGVRFIGNIARAIWHGVAAIGSAGWPLLFLLLAFLLVIVIILIGTLTIINDNQETSEVAALVAKLDDDLEKKIHSYGGGNAAIYYCDARGTYYQENEEGEIDFIDVDMRNETCELKTVNASSVKVYTNPEDIAAYIDAKYDGVWQVGSASWKLTVDFKGKTWTVVDWQHVPEFFVKGLNKVDRAVFEHQAINRLETYFTEQFPDMEGNGAYEIAVSVTAELSNILFDQQLQGVNDEVIYEAINAGVRKHREDLELSSDQLTELNYTLMEKLTTLVGDQEPTALVYDEIVDLHAYLNWWSEDYTHIDAASTGGMGGGTGSAGSSGMGGTNNASGYPNSSGYDETELAKWDGYNEVSLYGISEAGTTSVTGDGTRITNDWSDTNMAIACEGLQMAQYAYWTGPYKDLHEDSSQPVRVTMYNPSTSKTVTAEVRDVGGWRGYNDRYAGMNPTRQWDLLPAVWLALGGTQSSGLMNVYWKIDNAAPVTGGGGGSGGAAGAPGAKVEIEGYPWAAETDKGDSIIAVNRATYVRHEMADLLGNEQTFSAILGPDNYSTYAEFLAVREWLSGKLRYIMKPLLTDKNSDGDTYTDYFLSRRELGNPFGTYDGGKPVQWVITKRFNPGFEGSFDLDKAYAEIKPLSGGGSVHAVRKGTVEEVADGSVTITYKVDEQTDELMVYSNLSSIKVEAGDEVKEGTHLGNLSSGKDLRISWYEKFMIDMGGLKRKWAYCPTLFMAGFAGVIEPDQPTEYTGSGAGARDLKDCTTIVDFAYSRLGCPYVWGATGPDTFDCSGLTQWCYKQAGISIPRNSEAQHNGGTIIPLDESKMQPGDILWKPGHVGIYIGEGKCIHAPTTGDVVKISTISWWTEAVRYTS